VAWRTVLSLTVCSLCSRLLTELSITKEGGAHTAFLAPPPCWCFTEVVTTVTSWDSPSGSEPLQMSANQSWGLLPLSLSGVSGKHTGGCQPWAPLLCVGIPPSLWCDCCLGGL
jgi:hypothetical protein